MDYSHLNNIQMIYKFWYQGNKKELYCMHVCVCVCEKLEQVQLEDSFGNFKITFFSNWRHLFSVVAGMW